MMKQHKSWLQASVERNLDNKLHILWEDEVEEVAIYWSTSSEKIEENGQFLLRVSKASSCTIEDPSS